MAKEKNIQKHRRPVDMFPLMARYEQCELSGREFCRQHDLPHSTLNYWLKKYHRSQTLASRGKANLRNGTKQTDLSGFIPLKIRGTADGTDAISQKPIIEILYIDGTRLWLPADCGASIIRDLLPCFQP